MFKNQRPTKIVLGLGTSLLLALGATPSFASPTATPTPLQSSSPTPASSSASPTPTNTPTSSSSSTGEKSSPSADSSAVATPHTRTANAAAATTVTNQDGSVTVDNVTVSTKVLYDGTEYGTNNACYLTAAHGFPNGDENANDGVVCTGDTVAYQNTIAVAASDQPTTIDITYTQNGTFGGNDATALCASDTGGAFTGKVIAAPTYNSDVVECQFNVAPNKSVTFNRNSSSTEKIIKGTDKLQISFSVNNGNQATLASSETKVISTTASNLYFSPANNTYDTYTNISENGSSYYRYSYRLNHSEQAGKGFSTPNLQNPITITLDGLPSGTIVTDSKGLLNFSGNQLSGNITDASSTFNTTLNTIYVDVPANDDVLAGQNWKLHITQAQITNDSDYPNYLNSLSEPGAGQPVDFDTSAVPKVVPSLNIYGFKNDDWAGSNFTKTTTSVIPFTKRIKTSDGKIFGTDSWTDNPQRPNAPFDVLLDVPATNYSAPQMVFCDQWKPSWNNSTKDNLQQIDSSRPIIVKVGDNQITNYTVDYSDTPTCEQSGASSSPTSNTRSFRITIPGPVDASQGVSVDMPMKVSDISVFPNFPYPTELDDTGSVSFNDANNFSSPAQGHIQVSGAYADVYSQTDVSSLDSHVVKEVTAGSQYYWYDSVLVNPHGYESGDPSTQPLSHEVQMPICAVDPVAQITRPENLSSWSSKVIPGDYGPDGIPCTADDVSGDKVRVDYQWDTSSSSDFSIQVRFTVAPYASQGKVLNFKGSDKLYDPAGKTLVDYPLSDSVNVLNSSTVGQTKTVDIDRTPTNSTVGWRTVFFNNTTSSVTQAEFIDVLPYNGDSRGTKLASPLTQVNINTAGLNGGQVYVTTANPQTLSSDVTDASNDPSNTSLWCQYGSAGCPAGGNYTAVLFEFPSIDPMSQAGAHITASTTGSNDGDVLYNNLGNGNVPSINLPIPSTNNVKTSLFVPAAAISVNKTTSNPTAKVGDTINYTIAVQNTGTVDLKNPSVSDPGCVGLTENSYTGNVSAGDTNNDGLFNMDERREYTCTHVVTLDDLSGGTYVNTATVTAQSNYPNLPDATGTSSAVTNLISTVNISGYVYHDDNYSHSKDSNELPYTTYGQQLRLVGDDGTVYATVYADTTSGLFQFTDVEVSQPVHVQYAPNNESWKPVLITQAGDNKDFNTSGNASSQTINPGLTVTDVNFGLAYAPTLSMDKRADHAVVHTGDTVIYTLTVTSYDTSIPLDLHVDDPGCDNTPVYVSGDDNGNGLADANENFVYTCSHLLSADDLSSGSYLNTATATGDMHLPGLDNPTASADAVVSQPIADVYFQKMINNQLADTSPGIAVPLGSTMNIMFYIVNMGNVPLTNIQIADDVIPSDQITCYTQNAGPSIARQSLIGGTPWDKKVLSSGQQAFCEANYPAPGLNEIHVNHATLTATNDYTPNILTATSTAYAHSVNAHLTKTVDKVSGIASGDTLNYTIQQTIDQDNVAVQMNDWQCDNLSDPTGDTNGNGLLDHDETWTWTCSHVVEDWEVNSGSYTNTAHSSLSDDQGNAIINLEASATSYVQAFSQVRVTTCYNTDDCSTPASGVAVTVDATGQTTDAQGTTTFDGLVPDSNHDLAVASPAGWKVVAVYVDGNNVGTTIPASVSAPDSGVRDVKIVYGLDTASVPQSNPDNPVFDSGVQG